MQFTSGPAAGVKLNKNVRNKLISNEELELKAFMETLEQMQSL
jgi:hypothetical protein